jgi:hypothetical protein
MESEAAWGWVHEREGESLGPDLMAGWCRDDGGRFFTRRRQRHSLTNAARVRRVGKTEARGLNPEAAECSE